MPQRDARIAPLRTGGTLVELGFKALVAYLLGSVIGSLALGRLKGVDIRTQGSGNAGGTNALRTQGWVFALGVVVVDVGKALLAVGWLPNADFAGVGRDAAVERDWLVVACASAVVIGHVYPVWFGFRGGKGAATLVGAVLVLAPLALVPVVGVWLLTVMLTGYVGLGTMLGTATLPVYFALETPHRVPLVVFGLLMAAFVAYTHRSNLQRMRAGNENRARRLWLLRPR